MKQRFGAWGLVTLIAVALVASCSIRPPLGFKAVADIPTIQASSNLQAAGTSSSCVVSSGSTGSCVVVRCPAGQSTAQVFVPAGTLSGVVTVYTASDVNGAAGTYGAPPWSSAPGGTTNVSTISAFPGSLTITLGSTAWVEAVLTTATSGSATATISCSAAVAVNHGGGASGPQQTPAAGTCIGVSTPPAAGTISVTGTGCTPQPLVADSPLATATPLGVIHVLLPTPFPAVTSTACAAAPSVSGYTISVPAGCTSGPTPSPTPPFAIVQAAQSAPTGTGANTITFPATATSGDTLICVFFNQNANALGAPTGYTQEFSVNQGTAAYLWGYMKAPAAGTETSCATSSGTLNYSSGVFVELSGSHTFDVTATSGGTTCASACFITPASITPTAINDMFFAIGWNGAANAFANSTCFSNHWVRLNPGMSTGGSFSLYFRIYAGQSVAYQPPSCTLSFPNTSSAPIITDTFDIK